MGEGLELSTHCMFAKEAMIKYGSWEQLGHMHVFVYVFILYMAMDMDMAMEMEILQLEPLVGSIASSEKYCDSS